MAFTDSCDVFLDVHEAALNRVVRHLRRQRPSTFNIGSPALVANPGRACAKIDAHPVVLARGNPLIGLGPDLPVAGTSFLVEYVIQLAALEVDVSQGNVFALPPELTPLADQSIGAHARICAGLGCPPKELLGIVNERGAAVRDQMMAAQAREVRRPPRPPRRVELPFRELECFCLDFFLTGGAQFAGPSGDEHLVGQLHGIEIVDLTPTGLEDAIECYASLVVRLGLLPRLRVPLIRAVAGIARVGTLTVEPTPAPKVPHNPALEDDQIKVFLDVAVTPPPPPSGGGGGGGGGSAPPPAPGVPRPRTRTGPLDAVAALSERTATALFAGVRDNFGFDENGSKSFGPFVLSYGAAGHLENGTLDFRPDGSISISELDLKFTKLRACFGIDIPEICVGGFCLIPIPFDGCLVRAPKICLFDDDPDLEFCLDIAPFVRLELSAAVRPVVKYSVNPRRTAGMDDWDAHDAGVPNHWQIYIDPLTIDVDLFDIADIVGDLLDDAIDAALDTILGPLPDWAKDLIKAILGPLVDLVRDILDFGDDFSEWLADQLGFSLGFLNTILTLLSDYLASRAPFELADPVEALPASGGLIPVLIPIEFLGVRVTGDELVVEADLGD
ncbi:hypothetical protein [Conexibacter woesei]|uniref:hypothetical protein n=1 Tax=Conexibacter woesei TaxID=191495 RepID=UPI00040623DC|nr:hypothetical protein [Conexibacter woesei]